MKLKANAKINICLNVKGKRADGYHELEMIMVPITLHDDISIEFHDQDVYSSNDASIPMDASNTVVKAVELMRKTYAIKEHFAIHIEKNIPAQAGLAGGSSDGAAILRGINELTHLHIPINELAQLGKQIGADVPFCVLNECCEVKGIGERLTPIAIHCDFEILLVKPQVGVSTGKAFSMLDYNACDHPDCEKVRYCLEQNRFQELSTVCTNSLEYSAFQLVPQIKQIKEELQDMGFPFVLMSGSGSSVFAITRDLALLDKSAQVMKEKGYFVCKTKIK